MYIWRVISWLLGGSCEPWKVLPAPSSLSNGFRLLKLHAVHTRTFMATDARSGFQQRTARACDVLHRQERSILRSKGR